MRIILLAACFFLSCAHKPKVAQALPEQPTATPTVDMNEEILQFDPDVDNPNTLIYFQLNSAEVRAMETLRMWAAYILGNPGKVVIIGHACPLGAEQYNDALAYHRAFAVKTALTIMGIPSERMEIKSFGETQPLTLDPSQFERNRRVEITLRGE